MCLYIKDNDVKVKVADKDIVCYKKLNYHLGANTFCTPFMYMEITEEQLLGKEDIVPEEQENDIYKNAYGEFVARGGFIHSFKNKPQALKRTHKLQGQYLFKCIIPKGSEYLEGLDGNFCECYAAKKIRIVEAMNEILAQYLREKKVFEEKKKKYEEEELEIKKLKKNGKEL